VGGVRRKFQRLRPALAHELGVHHHASVGVDVAQQPVVWVTVRAIGYHVQDRRQERAVGVCRRVVPRLAAFGSVHPDIAQSFGDAAQGDLDCIAVDDVDELDLDCAGGDTCLGGRNGWRGRLVI